jgi:putative transposase
MSDSIPKGAAGGTPASASSNGNQKIAGVNPPRSMTRPRGRCPSRLEATPTQGETPASATSAADEFRHPDRKRPVHLPNIERLNQPVILFVTVCTKDRKPILANERVHAVLIRVWPQAEQYRVGRYVIMPDHIHLFCSPMSWEPENVKRWVAYWKRLATIQLRDLSPIWQRDCWDTQLRQLLRYDEKWEYVVNNPVRRGLVDAPEQWPFQGCLNELRW